MGNYTKGYALVLDVVDSRKMEVEARYALQNQIQKTCDYLNRVMASELLSKLAISAGDSVEGYFASPGAAFDAFRLFNIVLSPVKFRAGLAKGQVYSKYLIGKPNTNFVDGTAFHVARYCIEEAERSQRRFVAALDLSTDKVITDLVNFAFQQEDKMTPKQRALNCLQNSFFDDARELMEFRVRS